MKVTVPVVAVVMHFEVFRLPWKQVKYATDQCKHSNFKGAGPRNRKQTFCGGQPTRMSDFDKIVVSYKMAEYET